MVIKINYKKCCWKNGKCTSCACGGACKGCVEACPVGALKPYVVDPERCQVSVHTRTPVPKRLRPVLAKYEPQLTPATHVMCTRCQIVCPYTSALRRRNVVSLVQRPVY